MNSQTYPDRYHELVHGMKALGVEAVSAAILMGGGPAVVYGTESLKAYDEFVLAGIPN